MQARYIAKNIVAAGLAKITQKFNWPMLSGWHSVSVRIDTFEFLGTVAENSLKNGTSNLLRPLRHCRSIQMLDLKRPITVKQRLMDTWDVQTISLPWERLDKR